MSRPNAEPGLIVNKTGLAKALGANTVTLDRYLAKWPDFPVLKRGESGAQYQFDAAECVAFVKRKREERAEARGETNARISRIAEEDRPGEQPTGGSVAMKPAARLAQAKAMAAEDALAVRRGTLLRADDVRAVLAEVVTAWSRDMQAAIRMSARNHNLPSVVARAIEADLAAAQDKFVTAMQDAVGEA